jgi:hypothetical protein
VKPLVKTVLLVENPSTGGFIMLPTQPAASRTKLEELIAIDVVDPQTGAGRARHVLGVAPLTQGRLRRGADGEVWDRNTAPQLGAADPRATAALCCCQRFPPRYVGHGLKTAMYSSKADAVCATAAGPVLRL